MQPFFKSAYGSIVPFNTIISVTANSTSLDIKLVHGLSTIIAFKNEQNKNIQLKNYENYLINQYKLKELL